MQLYLKSNDTDIESRDTFPPVSMPESAIHLISRITVQEVVPLERQTV